MYLTSSSEKENGQTNDISSEDRQPVQVSENTEQEKAADDASSSAQEPSGEDGNVPVVYMTTEISAENLMAVYEALDTSPLCMYGTIPILLRFLKNFGRNVKATGLYFLFDIVLSALFQQYVPAGLVSRLFGNNEGFGVLMAATIGVPLYACGGGTI